MRVLMVLGDSTGGIGAHVDRLTRDLRAAGSEVVLATSASTAASFGWPDAHLLWPVHRGLSAPRGLVDWHLLKNLAGTVDVVHAHGHQAAVVAAVAVARARPRPGFVVSLHNMLPDDVAHEPDGTLGRMPLGSLRAHTVVSGAVRKVLSWAMRRAALVTGASEDLVELARGLGARQAELATVASPAVPRLLRAPVSTPAQRRTARLALADAAEVGGTDREAPLVLTVARIAPQKDLPTLVAAAGKVRGPIRWVVVGGGDERLRASLESELSGIPLDFVGAQPDVEAWLKAADVFVLTSRWEARALVVQEAMAAGVPVVAPRTGGLPGLIGEAGLLVPVGDAHAVADAVDRLLGDADLRRRLSSEARARAATWASPEEEARRWVARYTAATCP
ncbi:MAG TPA: glycosyltransferase family 4 protein [Intrasporangium sp.]|uniref:glycosyltransferase family 4 protein n=1 Tax=Intrasporangium sp. TaxID=1925024 RepID=UPI002B490CC9|nr:glycosyltransferase family 4 protein [Intrasporangium sp.]HKX67569.1 glycosyltransferase family 4 protein [Intrasporangium sp.]